METGDVISGFMVDDEITLHIVGDTDGDTMGIQIVQYAQGSDDYDWAADKLAGLGE